MDVLIGLAVARGEVVRRDELMTSVWHDAFVSENTVIQTVSRLRRALDDTPHTPAYIETIAKTGYRLIAPVTIGWPGVEHGQAAGRSTGLGRATPVVLLAVLVGATVLMWSTSARESTLLETRPLLTNPGRQPDPALSPDGANVAFVWQAPDRTGWDLYLQEVDADQPVRLTPESGAWQFPTWTADGRLAVLSDDGQCDIVVASLDRRTVTPAAACPPGSTDLNWSPDGSTFVVSAPGDHGRDLILIDAITGARTALPPIGGLPDEPVLDISPAFSPDGGWIAFARVRSPSRHLVMVSSLDGTDVRELTTDAWGQVRGLDWRADGASVVYSSNRSGSFRLWQVGLNGTAPERLPIEDEWLVSPSLAQARERLVYRTFKDEIDLWAMRPDADEGQPLAPVRVVQSTRSEHEPMLSPDGTRVAFVSDRTGSMELWSAGIDGSRVTRHTHLNGPRPTMAAWSPDGNDLVFSANPEGQYDLYRVARNSRQPMRLTASPDAETNATYSRDGKRLYFASDRSGQWQLWTMPAAGGAAEQVTDSGAFYGQEDQEGNFLYFVRLEEPGLWRQRLPVGTAEQVLEGYDFADWASWAVTTRGIYFSRHAVVDGYPRPSIELMDLTSQAVTVISRPGKQMPYLSRSLTASADGRLLIVSLIERSDDEILLVDLR